MLYCLSAERRYVDPGCEAVCISSTLTKAPFLAILFMFILGALHLYCCICPPPLIMRVRNKFCPGCSVWAHCKAELISSASWEQRQSATCQETLWTVFKVLTVFLLTRENVQYGESRGRHGSHKIYLPFGLDYNNKMSESPHGTLIWSNCLQKNQSHAFFWKTRRKEEEKNPFIFILLASLIFFYFSLTFRK